MKQRVFALFISFAILLPLFPAGLVLAAEDSFDTIEEILGVDMIASSNVWDFADSTMTSYARSGYESIITPSGTDFTEEGLDLSGTNGSDRWRFSAFRSWSPVNVIGNASFRAVYFKVKGSVHTEVKTADNYSIVRLSSQPDVALSSMKTSQGESAIREVYHDITPDGNWVEYLMVPRNTNAVYLWARSETLTGGKWIKAIALERYYYTSGSSDSNYNEIRERGINFSGSGIVAEFRTIDYNTDSRVIVASDEEAGMPGANVLWFDEEFESQTLPSPLPTIGSGVSLRGEGVAEFPARYQNDEEGIAATDGSLIFSDVEIPENGYAEIRLRSNGEKNLLIDDGVRRIKLTLYCDYSAFPGTTLEGGGYVADSDVAWRTWRFVRKEEGYSVYSKTDQDSGWRIHSIEGIGEASAGNKRISISLYGNADGVSDGNGQVDYIKIYGQKPEHMLELLDGHTTNLVTDYDNISYPGNIYALAVCDPDIERSLVLAQYGENDILTDIKTFPVPRETGSVLVPVDLADKESLVRNYKLFLWDGMGMISPASRSVSVKGNMTVWQDEWELGGNAKAENETIILDAKAGKTSFAERNVTVPDAFDISWSMEIESFGEAETVSVNTGRRCLSLTISSNEISYLTNGGIKTTPWAVGNKKHRYRLLHKDGVCHLLIDGYYVDVLTDIKNLSGASGIRFENQGEDENDSIMRIEPMTIGAYSAASVPQSKGFYDTFESVEESLNWKFTPREEEDGGEVSAWEVADGNLQCVDFRTRGITSVAQRYFRDSIGDDYIFMARMQIPSFGTSGMLNIYLPNRSLVLDLKQMFFSMRDKNSALSANNNNPATVYSDPLMIDTSKWYEIRIETFDYCNKVRVFWDNKKIMEGELSTTELDTRVLDFRSQSDWSNPFAIKYDWFKCAPIVYDVTVSGISDGDVIPEGTPISLSASVNGMAEEVEYQLSGHVVATGTGYQNRATLTALSPGSYELTAVSGNKTSAPISFTVKGAGAETNGGRYVSADSNYANEISYDVIGDGTVTFGNGMHLLQMTHSDGKLSYQTDTGSVTYEFGVGSFDVITEGPVADVYRNGQFAFSFYMPMSDEKTTSFTGSVTGKVNPSEERQTYFSANNVAERKKVYRLSELPTNHVIDFVADMNDNVHFALNDGYYRTNLSLEKGEIYVWDGQRNNSLATKTKVGTLNANEAYYRIETSAGMSRLYQNGRWIATFRGVPTVDKNTFAVNVISGSLKYLAVCDNVDLYLHRDDFSGKGELDSVEYWKTSNGIEMTVDEEREALCLHSLSENGIAELSSSCGNAELSADVTMESGDGLWFIANHATRGSYTKVGYNFKNNRYEIVDVVATAEGVTETVINSKAGTLQNGKTVSMKIAVRETKDGKKATLFVNGEEMLSGTSEFFCRGSVGFLLSNGTAIVDNIAFRGDAKPVYGVRESVVTGSLMMDMIENFDTNEIYLLNSAGVGFSTDDGGKSWKEKKVANPVSNHLHQFYKDTELNNGEVFEKGDILAISKNGNGTINGVRMNDDYGQALYANYTGKSTDYGQSWSRYSVRNYFFPKLEEVKATGESNGATVNAFKRGYSGRFYYVANTGGNEDYGGANVWYSDNAKSWNLSKTKILSKDLGFVIAEAQVLETKKFTRLYFRSDIGSIGYFESYDHGETWDLTPHKTPFISIASCFNIEVDPLNPDTIYIAWIYDNTNLFARHQFPRMRWAVAKSVDAGETWEMIGTVHENTSVYHENSNMTISVSADYVFVSAQSSEYYRRVSPMNTRIVAFPKEGQKTSKRFEQLHLQYPDQVENTRVMLNEQVDRTMVIQPNTGAVWLQGVRYENAYKGQYVSLDCATKLVGAKMLRQENGTIVLGLGAAEIPFYLTELSNRNGETFVSLMTYAERFGLTISEEEDGVILVSENQDWSMRQRKAFRYAVDLFTDQP